ncbi:MAG: ComEC/Rec2 family competence protein [Lachnospiraceae bacterium]
MRQKRNMVWLIMILLLQLLGCGDATSQIESTVPQIESTASQSGGDTSQTETVDAVNYFSENKSKKEVNEEQQNAEGLEVHFIDVGQGDATLIKQGEHAMLIDAGNNNMGTRVQSYLNSQQIKELDYVIGTHPDADHVGGLDVILYKFNWNTVILPNIEKDTKTYQEVLQVISDKNQRITEPKVGSTYSLGKAKITIVAPVKDSYGENVNDYSVGILLEFGENRFLFTGDAEAASEEDMLKEGIDLSADVYKLAHHGSDTANTKEFLQAVQPKSVVISCGEGNSYGHPRAAVLNELRGMGAAVYRTDEQGTIVAYSNGKDITFQCAPSDSWKAGEPTGGSEESIPKTQDTEEKETQGIQETQDIQNIGNYVLNQNTMKFHNPDCSSVTQMKEKNRVFSNETKEKLLEEGYEPCGRCNP